MRYFTFCVLAVLLLLTPASASAKALPESFDFERNQLVAYMVSQQLAARHFGHERINDALSFKIYDLYLRQLDPRKRFLLQADLQELNRFRDRIDDELKSGNIRLPDVGRRLLDARIREVDAMIDPILDAGFDFKLKETLEVDPKKLDFVPDTNALRERWRLSLKMQALDSFFEAIEDKKKAEPEKYQQADPAVHPELMAETIRKVRESSHRSMQRLQQQTRQDHYDRYFDAVARGFDPHSNYMPPTTKEDFDIQMSGSLEGIGALLREDEGLIKVVRILPGSAAEKQGQLQAEDTILSVAEKGGEPIDISEMRIREAVSLIRGPKGSEVVLTVRKPGGGRMSVAIVRDVVRLEETYVKSALLHTGQGKAIGYIRIPSFYRDFNADGKQGPPRNATDDTRRIIRQLKNSGIEGLILDLRNNGGGALDDAVSISGLFLPGGPVVQVRDGEGAITVRADEDLSVEYGGLMVVLVNQFSASASEILAAAMQDYGRAMVIGSKHTHGKGTVQAMMDLNRYLPLFRSRSKVSDLGALKMTIQKFYRINGGSTQFRGVSPDLVVPSMLDHLESGEQYMDYALPWDQVLPVPYQIWQGPRFDRVQAEQEGANWVASSPSFQKIFEESEKARIRAQQTVVTVTADDMWRERQILAQAREEAKAAGLLETPDEEENESGGQKKNEKKLEEILALDPYVQLSLELFANAAK
ncbi:MAG: carboxy terminal-processing peptidase [bacterium]|nr:carboxy terminal-processing peptidase [bacterium]